MIVCHCVGVTDCTIKRLIEAGASTVAEITRVSGAGRCCAPCRDEIETLLYSTAAAPHNSPPQYDIGNQACTTARRLPADGRV